MIDKLSIRNFKSIKELDLDCKRINLFIGEPNTGKSNILEALGLLSWCGYINTGLIEYVRFQGLDNLFYDGLLDKPIQIKIQNSEIINILLSHKEDISRIQGAAGKARYPEVNGGVLVQRTKYHCTSGFLGSGQASSQDDT